MAGMSSATCPRCGSNLVTVGSMLVCGAFYAWQGTEDAMLSRSERQEKGITPPCEYTEVRRSFSVPVCNLPRLTAKIETLARKAAKLGCPAPQIHVGETREEQVTDQDGRKTWITFAAVEVYGEAPQINGWTFGATIDHDGDENVIRGVVPGYPAHYRTALPVCEHCRLSRKRAETFLLVSETGEWRQVGRSCLKDFLGHSEPASMANAAEYLAEAFEEADEVDGWDGIDAVSSGDPDIVQWLSYVALAIRKDGWTPRSAKHGEATVDTAEGWYWGNAGCAKAHKKPEYPLPEEQDIATATAALVWARGLGADGEDLSDFLHNVRAASKRCSVGRKNVGITAFIVAGYLKAEIKRKEHANKKPSEHVGTKGQRFGAKGTKQAPGFPEIEVTVLHVFSGDSGYGTTHTHIMEDASGNVFKWTASNECLKLGGRFALAGTVKDHGEYKGTKQTVLTRCTARSLDPVTGSDVVQGQIRAAVDPEQGVLVVGKKYIAADVRGFAHYEITTYYPEEGTHSGGQWPADSIVAKYPVLLPALPAMLTVEPGERMIGDSGAKVIIGEADYYGRYDVTLVAPDGKMIEMGYKSPKYILDNYPNVHETADAA